MGSGQGESMPKGLVRRQGEPPVQFGKADQDQGQPGLVVHPAIEQQAQIVEHAVCYLPHYFGKSCVFISYYFGHKRSAPAVGCP